MSDELNLPNGLSVQVHNSGRRIVVYYNDDTVFYGYVEHLIEVYYDLLSGIDTLQIELDYSNGMLVNTLRKLFIVGISEP